MKLRVYLAIHKISQEDFSKKINYHRNTVGELCNELRRPSKKLAFIVEQATDGEVTAKELLEIPKKN